MIFNYKSSCLSTNMKEVEGVAFINTKGMNFKGGDIRGNIFTEDKKYLKQIAEPKIVIDSSFNENIVLRLKENKFDFKKITKNNVFIE